ncbi:metallophosphoesterase [Omnitrophica bacterium]|nr:metallophosphoesterase [Candidatus Omnitrophota bacterium]
MPKRTIIFGDIHGCFVEWRELMRKLHVTREDRLISVGDLVCKGPSTRKCLDLAQKLPNLQCVLGNQELDLLQHWKEDRLEDLPRDYQKSVVEELGNRMRDYLYFISTWPLFLDEPDYLVVHAGIRVEYPLERQKAEEVTNLREIDGKPWYEYYKEKKLIVHGHWATQGLVVRDNVIGLDSGCVYGKKLSALILPEREIVSVDAHKAYAGA